MAVVSVIGGGYVSLSKTKLGGTPAAGLYVGSLGPVMFFHGHNASSIQSAPGSAFGLWPTELAKAGYYVWAGDNTVGASNTSSFASPEVINKIDADVDAVLANWTGAYDDGKVDMVGWSGGGGDILAYVLSSPARAAKVRRIFLYAPAVDSDWGAQADIAGSGPYVPSYPTLPNGANRLTLPGSAGNFVDAPDSAALSVTGDLDLRFRGALSWGLGPYTLLAKSDATVTEQRSYRLATDGSGHLQLILSADGINTVTATSSVAHPFGGGVQNGWARATWRQSDKQVQFFTSTNGVVWTQLGTDQSINIASIFDSTAHVEIGSCNAGSTQVWAGSVIRAEIRNGIDGTIVGVFDTNSVNPTDATHPTQYVDGLGNTWVLNGASWSWSMGKFTESFTKADSVAVGSDLTWTDVFGDIQNVGNRGAQVSTGTNQARSRAEHDMATSDMYAEAKVTVPTPSTLTANAGVCVRYDPASDNCYMAYLQKTNAGVTSVNIAKVVNGAVTVIGGPYAGGSSGQLLRLEVVSNVLTVYINGSLKGTVNDGSIVTGTRAGITTLPRNTGSTTYVDDFACGDMPITPVPSWKTEFDALFSGNYNNNVTAPYRLRDQAAAFAALNIPTHIVCPDSDTVLPPQAAMSWADAAAAAGGPVTKHVLVGGNHTTLAMISPDELVAFLRGWAVAA